jgi:hypothetical protein
MNYEGTFSAPLVSDPTNPNATALPLQDAVNLYLRQQRPLTRRNPMGMLEDDASVDTRSWLARMIHPTQETDAEMGLRATSGRIDRKNSWRFLGWFLLIMALTAGLVMTPTPYNLLFMALVLFFLFAFYVCSRRQ